MSASLTARAGSIFDDDYAPPKRQTPKADVQPAPTPDVKPPAPTPTPTPPEVAKPNVVETPAPPISTSRRSIPTKDEQTKCGKMFDEAFADQLKDKSPVARKKLSESLIKEAAKNSAVPVDYFVLLKGALNSAEEGSNLRLSFAAIDELTRSYKLDALAAKADAVEKVWSAATPATASVANVQSAFDIMDELLADDDFATAAKVASALQHGIGAIRDTELKSAVANRVRDFDVANVEREKISPSLEKLKTAPADAAANFAVGSFWCFTRGQWEKGLPYLARGNDPAIKSLATSEMLKSGDAEAAAKVADGWWDAASKMTALGKMKTQIHAAALYRGVIANIPGLRRLAIEKRIAETPSTDSPRRIDLLDIFDPAVGVVSGKWRMEGETLTCEPGEFSRVEFPYTPSEEYDFRISFVVIQENDAIEQLCYHAGHQFGWNMGGQHDTACGFERINGAGSDRNPTARHNQHWLSNGKRYTSVVKVRKTGTEAFINEQPVSNWKTDYSDMATWPGWQLRHENALGLGAHDNSIKFDFAEVIEVTGQGKEIK
ncbi:MAG TPA: hypothetical protein VFE47_19755 [Tepidisphaeraceae bacterium]|nr:hypothetical protein [Tepidisphaeraceae bacterium]